MTRRKKHYPEEQILYALQQVDNGRKISEVCNDLGVTERSYYRWKRKYASNGEPILEKIKILEHENANLRKLVADLSLDKRLLLEMVSKEYKETGCLPS